MNKYVGIKYTLAGNSKQLNFEELEGFCEFHPPATFEVVKSGPDTYRFNPETELADFRDGDFLQYTGMVNGEEFTIEGELICNLLRMRFSFPKGCVIGSYIFKPDEIEVIFKSKTRTIKLKYVNKAVQ